MGGPKCMGVAGINSFAGISVTSKLSQEYKQDNGAFTSFSAYRTIIQLRSKEGLVHALLIIQLDEPDGPLSESLVAKLIQDSERRAGGRLALARFFPRVGALLVAGSPVLLAELIANERVLIASATTIGLFPSFYGYANERADCAISCLALV